MLASQECGLTSFQHIDHIVDLGTHINMLFMSHENRHAPRQGHVLEYRIPKLMILSVSMKPSVGVP